MHQLKLFRWLRGSDQNYFNVLKEDTNIKQIRGWRKQNFNSLIDIMYEHNLIEKYYFIDKERFIIYVYNESGQVIRYWRYYIIVSKEGS